MNILPPLPDQATTTTRLTALLERNGKSGERERERERGEDGEEE